MKFFDLELVSPCNAKCDFCPQKFLGVKRQNAFMDEEVLDKVTAEIGSLARTEPVTAFLCGMGENLSESIWSSGRSTISRSGPAERSARRW
jgi:hypothetical protein